MDAFGLVLINDDNSVCPLQIVKVDAVLDLSLANVKVFQEYYYEGDSDIQAIYKFPLSPDAQVTDLNIKIGCHEINGELKEKEEAIKYYEKNIRKGDSAFLLDSFRDDCFQISLGNIEPETKISIEIGYIENLRSLDSIIRWTVPTTIAPKYEANDYGEPKHRLEVSTTILEKNLISKVSSPSHPLEFSYDNNEIRINLSKEIEYLDRDFVLNIHHNHSAENILKIGTDEENTFGELKIV
ncbi:MAG: VIT domain-containing protein, partial [Tissierellia bacterium]|nr:VIT domain-containing protein [Tissierellia bacterium]